MVSSKKAQSRFMRLGTPFSGLNKITVSTLIAVWILAVQASAIPQTILKDKRSRGLLSEAMTSTAEGLYALGNVTDIDGNQRDLADFAGMVSIVVNVASHCGYTDSNYKGLQAIYEDYQEKGFVILGFPCNQFLRQESGTCPAIKAFVTEKYEVTFPMFDKVDVNGPNTHPVYRFLKENLPDVDSRGGPDFRVGWNFFKFLVGRDGMPVKLFRSPFNRQAIESELLPLLESDS